MDKIEGANNINPGKTIKSIIIVTISNICNILAGIAVGFLIPKILSVSDYGYYKIFTLYSGYVGLASLGIIDGIVLIYGGNNYETLDRLKFRSYFRWYLLIHSIISAIILIISVIFLNNEYKYIFVFFGIFMIANNFTGYFQYISQITLRFKELSIRNIIKSSLTVLGVLLLYIIYKVNPNYSNFKTYIMLLIFFNYVLMFWYVYTYRDLIFGEAYKLKETKKDILKFIKCGFPLFFSILCASLILTLDRQFVSVLWPVDQSNEYSTYAFAYNMLSLVTVATSAISTVIYPTLKRTDEKTLKTNYHLLICIDIIFIFVCMTSYFPLCWFINWFLPKYNDSLIIFRIIFPGIAISSVITVVIHNYYKTFGLSTYYFIYTLITLILSFIANLVAYLIFKTTVSISIASICTMVFWYFIVQVTMVKKFSVPWLKNSIALFLGSTIFYVLTIIDVWYFAMILYILTMLLLLLFLYFKEFKEIKRILQKK